MKKLIALLATIASLGAVSTANAADMPVKAAPITPTPVMYNWSGFYVGVQGGGAWGNTHHFDVGVDTGDFRMRGGAFGATAGYNIQFNQFVAGIEGDYSWSRIRGEAGGGIIGNFGCGSAADRCNTDVKSFGTARARLGYAANQFLVYATGGWAYGRIHAGIDPVGIPLGVSSDVNKSGWTGGFGLEYGFTPNLSAKVEYLHVHFGDFVYGTPPTFPNTSASANFNLVRAGLNYRFSGLRF